MPKPTIKAPKKDKPEVSHTTNSQEIFPEKNFNKCGKQVPKTKAPTKYPKAFPNPFNPMATISLSVARNQQVTIALFDALGRQVQTIYHGVLSANKSHSFQIDGSTLPSGMYHYVIQGAFFNTSKPILLLK